MESHAPKSPGPGHEPRKTIVEAMTHSECREEEDNAALHRARSIKITTNLAFGQSIPEAMQDISADMLRMIDGVRTPSPELIPQSEHFVPILFEACHRHQKKKETASLMLQKIFRGRQERKKATVGNLGVPALSSSLPDGEVTPERRSKRVGWTPSELKADVMQLLEDLNADSVAEELGDANNTLSNRAMENIETTLDATRRTRDADRTIADSVQWDQQLKKKLRGSSDKVKDDVYECGLVGHNMADLGHRVLAEREKWLARLAKDAHLVLDEEAHQALEEKKQIVQSLGNRLVEIRSVQEHSGPQADDLKQVSKLQDDIAQKQGELETLFRWMANIERHMGTLEHTMEYLERNQTGPVPEEGVLETIEEVKGAIRRKKVEPIMKQYDAEHGTGLEELDDSELVELQVESARLQEVLDKMNTAIKQVPDARFHEDKMGRRLVQVCGQFNTTSGIIDQSPAPRVNAHTVPDLRDSLITQLDELQNTLKPGLKHLPRFEAIMQHAQQSLDFLSYHRGIYMEHVQSVKESLLADTMAVDTTPATAHLFFMPGEDALKNQEDRWRQTIRAFHDVQDKLCGGVEEVEARLSFAKTLVEEGLGDVDQLRRHCDRNRWETQDCLANCQSDKDRPDARNLPLQPFDQERFKLRSGAVEVRQQRWEEDLKTKKTAGKEAAQRSREVQSAKAAIAAEVEAIKAAAVQFGGEDAVQFGDEGFEEEEDDEEQLASLRSATKGLLGLHIASRRNTPVQGGSAVSFARPGTPPLQTDGKKHFQSLAKKAKFASTGTSKMSPTSPPISPKGKARPKAKRKDPQAFRSTPTGGSKKDEGKRGSVKQEHAEDEDEQASYSPEKDQVHYASESHEGSSASSAADGAAATDTSSGVRSSVQNLLSVSKPEIKPKAKAKSASHGPNPLALPAIPAAAQTVEDIVALDMICRDLAAKAKEASESCRSLAARIGGHPLEPGRNHILNGDEGEKQKVKELMESLISGRKAWWQSRQSLTVKACRSSHLSVSKEVHVFNEVKAQLRLAAKNDMDWLKDVAVRKLQRAFRPIVDGILNERRRKAQEGAALAMQKVARGMLTRKGLQSQRAKLRSVIVLQAVHRGNHGRQEAKQKAALIIPAATKIQRAMRGKRARRLVEAVKASMHVQRLVRGFLARKLAKGMFEERLAEKERAAEERAAEDEAIGRRGSKQRPQNGRTASTRRSAEAGKRRSASKDKMLQHSHSICVTSAPENNLGDEDGFDNMRRESTVMSTDRDGPETGHRLSAANIDLNSRGPDAIGSDSHRKLSTASVGNDLLRRLSGASLAPEDAATRRLSSSLAPEDAGMRRLSSSSLAPEGFRSNERKLSVSSFGSCSDFGDDRSDIGDNRSDIDDSDIPERRDSKKKASFQATGDPRRGSKGNASSSKRKNSVSATGGSQRKNSFSAAGRESPAPGDTTPAKRSAGSGAPKQRRKSNGKIKVKRRASKDAGSTTASRVQTCDSLMSIDSSFTDSRSRAQTMDDLQTFNTLPTLPRVASHDSLGSGGEDQAKVSQAAIPIMISHHDDDPGTLAAMDPGTLAAMAAPLMEDEIDGVQPSSAASASAEQVQAPSSTDGADAGDADAEVVAIAESEPIESRFPISAEDSPIIQNQIDAPDGA